MMPLCLMGRTLTQAVAADNSQSIAPDNYMKSIQAPPTPPPTFWSQEKLLTSSFCFTPIKVLLPVKVLMNGIKKHIFSSL
jgi:hypothetical protein